MNAIFDVDYATMHIIVIKIQLLNPQHKKVPGHLRIADNLEHLRLLVKVIVARLSRIFHHCACKQH